MIKLEPEATAPPPSDAPEAPAASPPDVFVDQKLDPPPAPRPWHLTYYHSLFDVATYTVIKRLGKTVNPLAANDFFEGMQPDLYGPVWTCFTLVFLFTAGGNFTEYIDSTDEIDWVDNLTKVTVALLLFFGLFLSIPVVSRCLLWRLDAKPTFPELLSLYGYSLVLYFPAAILCLFPIGRGRWVVLSIAGAWSAAVMFKNYRKQFEGTGGKKRWALAAMVLAGHAGIILSGGFYFFI